MCCLIGLGLGVGCSPMSAAPCPEGRTQCPDMADHAVRDLVTGSVSAQAYTGIWQGVAKADLATSPLGNVVPLSCHNCYNGPNNEVYSAAEANAKIDRALGRNADLIELDIADAGGTLCVTHDDVASCGSRPTLQQIFDNSRFADADALVFAELKEGNVDADTFATRLLTALDDNRAFATSGRPFFIRAFHGRIAYLQAIQDRLGDYPMIAPHLRFSVLYGRNAVARVADFQAAMEADVLGNGFHMVELEYRTKNLAGLTAFARSQGLAVGLYTIPGAFGEVYLAALRERVDQLTAEYRIDQARRVVEEPNTFAHVDAAACQSSGDTSIAAGHNLTGSPGSALLALDVVPTSSAHGSPALWYDGPGEDRHGCSLDFRSNQGYASRALALGTHSVGADTGYLVSAVVNFDALSGFTGTQAIINSSEAGGFALELQGNGATTQLRFGVHVGGSYRYHAYDVSSTGLSSPNRSLNGTDGYLLVGAYDGDGGVYLWIDNERNGSGGSFSGGVTSSGQPTLVGADPQPGAALGARFFFDGFVQQAAVLRWGDHSFGGSIVN